MKALVLLLALCPLAAFADSWLPPSVRAHVSESGDWIVRVVPAETGPDRSMKKPAHCEFLRFDRSKDAYVHIRGHDLVNPVCPGAVVFPDDGSFLVTFDDYMGVGDTENLIVVYDSTGKMLKRWTLEDLLPTAEIDALPHSTMSIHWRGSVGVMHANQTDVYISPPKSPFDPSKKFKGFMLDVKSLTIREDK